MREQIACRGRRAKIIHADKAVTIAEKPVPWLADGCLDRNPRTAAENAVPPGFILLPEQLEARNRDNGRCDAVACQLFARGDGNTDF